MGPFEMVVAIVLIATIGSVLQARYKARGRQPGIASDPEVPRLREEIGLLKERVQVLERIVTDKNHLLEAEFERLRRDERDKIGETR
jgi:hypothetical protein